MFRSKYLLVGAPLLVLFAVVSFRLFRFDPRFSLSHLRGHTPDQIISELGPPDFDPRTTTPPWDEKEDGPIVFDYHGPMFQEYAIIFGNNRVVEVKRTTK